MVRKVAEYVDKKLFSDGFYYCSQVAFERWQVFLYDHPQYLMVYAEIFVD
jgi:hypothetical protein